MADVIKTTSTLQMVAQFADDDDRTINIPNPKSNIAGSDINGLGDYIKTNKVLIGDKAGADFTGFKSAKTVKHKTTYLDLTL